MRGFASIQRAVWRSWVAFAIFATVHILGTGAEAQTTFSPGTLPVEALDWTADGNPYRIPTSQVYVPEGHVLRIGPGVRVELGFLVSLIGEFDVQGTAEAPVTFTRLEDNTAWGQIRSEGSTPSNFQHVHLEGSVAGLQTNAGASVSKSVFNDNGVDLTAASGTTTVHASRFEGSSRFQGTDTAVGVSAAWTAQLLIDNSLITDKSDTGIRFSTDADSLSSGIHHCTLVGNEIGVDVYGIEPGSIAVPVYNSIIAHGDTGIRSHGQAGAIARIWDTLLWGNRTALNGVSYFTGERILEDPLFRSETDYRLQPQSPAVDAADDVSGIPQIDLDGVARPWGGASDLGAFEYAPLCGNGDLEEGELCDDGNAVDTDACTNQCRPAECGDGIVHEGHEACDDGNEVANDGCNNFCIESVCGNHIVERGEQCDDGNIIDRDGCTNDCRAPLCGNGVLNPEYGEACDDGNVSNVDGCLMSCQPSFCGDGFVNRIGEECDGTTGCSDDCLLLKTADADAVPACGVGKLSDGRRAFVGLLLCVLFMRMWRSRFATYAGHTRRF